MHSNKYGWQVAWCKDCPAIGIVQSSPGRDAAVDWANRHYAESTHQRVASLPYTQLRDLYQNATEIIKAAEERLS